ncbi:hypothetical protein [Nocardia jinanensis]|uniref:DUF1542 domain-containing protein n=1 Tax=Nocardia jinanensis TaxID=382504 RepID=A0A917RD89_9NOCA|nr:hypothetical protein [Nocardia jinanensis]GGL02761.1 hypothetical protein GCM10011588_16900 [Nocardia jinanensis]
MEWLLIAAAVVLVAIILVWRSRQTRERAALELADALAEARRVNERLGGQIYSLTGSNTAAQQALADAAERHIAAGSQVDQAGTPVQARLAKETAIEGLYYIRAARTAMDMDPGPVVPELEGRATAGEVSEDRVVDFENRRIAASARPSSDTPNYYPGGRVAGRPVPAGWYSEPWWKPAMIAGAWGLGSALLFTSLFSGMSGVGYGAEGFESGYGEGYEDGLTAGDQGYGGQADDSGGQDYQGGDGGGIDGGGFDF